MPPIGDYSTTPGNNSSVGGINIAENCAPANVNNAIRQVMADIATAIGALTASAAELNTLDGITATTTELNLLDGLAAVETTATDVTTAFPIPARCFVAGAWTYSAAQATTSGTAIDFTDIPAWATEVMLILDGVSLSSTGDLAIQLGDAGGVEATGYAGGSALINNGVSPVTASHTSSFGVPSGDASAVFDGFVTFVLYSGNIWKCSYTMRRGAASSVIGHGDKELSDTLTTIRLTRAGSDTFDAGAARIAYR